MELRDYVRIALRYWALILVTAVLGLGAGIGATVLMPEEYESRTQLYVSVRSEGEGADDLVQGATFASQIVGSYVNVISTGVVLDPVVERLNLNLTGEELAEQVRADSPAESVLINITATAPDPEQAAQIANAVGASFKTVVRTQLENNATVSGSAVDLTTTQAATAPAAPSSPNLILNLALGLLAGIVLGYGAAVFRSSLDQRLRSSREVEQVSGKPVLGRIAEDPSEAKRPLISGPAWQSPRGESFRTLRTNLRSLDEDESNRVYVVTSSTPDEAKTITAVNLAIALAQTDARVALVDGDLRRPEISGYLGIEAGVGLADVLVGRVELEDVLQPWGRNELSVLAAGRIPTNPAELLGSTQMEETMRTLRSQFDYVILDAPPVLAVTDAAVVGKLASGTLLVVTSGTTTRQTLGGALRALETAGTDVLGTVVTRVPAKEAGRYDYPSRRNSHTAMVTSSPLPASTNTPPALVPEN